MLDPEIVKQVQFLAASKGTLLTDIDGNLILSMSHENIFVNICQDDSEKKTITIYSNASLSRTGFLTFLEWLGDHGYRYNYAAPNISYHNYRSL